MRQILTIFLLAIFSSQVFHPAIVIFDYYSNTVAYAKNCVNKLTPSLHCNGKCELMKKLQEEQNKEQRNTERKGEKADFVYRSAGIEYLFDLENVVSSPRVLRDIDVATCGYHQPIFHPPST